MILLGVCLSLSLICACEGAPAASPRELQSLAPDTELVALDGHATRFATELRGHPALVSFWASWCDACVAEFPSLNALAKDAADGALVVGVAVGETREKAADTAREKGLVYANFVDPEFTLADALGQRNVPTTLVVDRGGVILYRGGALDRAALDAFERAKHGGVE